MNSVELTSFTAFETYCKAGSGRATLATTVHGMSGHILDNPGRDSSMVTRLLLREDPGDSRRRGWIHTVLLLYMGKGNLANVLILSLESIDWIKWPPYSGVIGNQKLTVSSVLDLQLSCCKFPSFQSFIRLLKAFPSLRQLHLSIVRCAESPVLSQDDIRAVDIGDLLLVENSFEDILRRLLKTLIQKA